MPPGKDPDGAEQVAKSVYDKLLQTEALVAIAEACLT